MATTLPRSFYARDPVVVARELLGAELHRREADGSVSTVTVSETEAYSQTDPASHSFRGKTARTAVMFGTPGIAYVYFIYGMYFCFNVVCERDGVGAAVLVRGGEPVSGIARMAERRGLPYASTQAPERALAQIGSGPGKLCQALAIRREEHNGIDLADASGPLFITPGPAVPAEDVLVGSRVGIRQARERPWRFGIRGSWGVSRHPFVIAGPE